MQSPQSQEIVERFFKALQFLIDDGRIKSRNSFCTEYGFVQSHLWRQEADPSRKIFEMAWMTPLVTEYDISARWLMTGEGTMVFKSPPDKGEKPRNLTMDEVSNVLPALMEACGAPLLEKPCCANVVQEAKKKP